LTALAKVHRALAHLFAGLVVLQFGLAGWGAFKTDYDQKFNDNNFGPHALLGSFLVLLALIILLLAAAGRWSSAVTRLSGALFGLMVVQFILGVTGASDSPYIGVLHGMNALAIAFLTYRLIRVTRTEAPSEVVATPISG
jgi:uncharacterized membrane protein YidH (DUF202 family)